MFLRKMVAKEQEGDSDRASNWGRVLYISTFKLV
jgi:hypothetical protein